MKFIVLVLGMILTSCASLTENSWQNNKCYDNDSDYCKHLRYEKSIKR